MTKLSIAAVYCFSFLIYFIGSVRYEPIFFITLVVAVKIILFFPSGKMFYVLGSWVSQGSGTISISRNLSNARNPYKNSHTHPPTLTQYLVYNVYLKVWRHSDISWLQSGVSWLFKQVMLDRRLLLSLATFDETFSSFRTDWQYSTGS